MRVLFPGRLISAWICAQLTIIGTLPIWTLNRIIYRCQTLGVIGVVLCKLNISRNYIKHIDLSNLINCNPVSGNLHRLKIYMSTVTSKINMNS